MARQPLFHRKLSMTNLLLMIGVAVSLMWCFNLLLASKLEILGTSQHNLGFSRGSFEQFSYENSNHHLSSPTIKSNQFPEIVHYNSSAQNTIPSHGRDNSTILHIVSTRFMQFQPDLVQLGLARLWLFETFCLPTMVRQTTNNFVWAILTDPNLHPDLLKRLQTMLKPYSNFYLIKSNSAAFELRFLMQEPSEVSQFVLTGDVSNLWKLFGDRNRAVVLQTRVDADDGIHRKTLRALQTAASSLISADSDGWKIICANLHFEWRNTDILNVSLSTDEMSSGKLRLVQEQICVTPGLTTVYQRNVTHISPDALSATGSDMQHILSTPPRIKHHVINRDWPLCVKPSPDAYTRQKQQQQRESRNETADCYIKLAKYPAAIRSRTITSAGMSRINGETTSSYENATDIFWQFLQRDFGIPPDRARKTSAFLHSHFQSIAMDNLRGQCSQGHSCKNSSKLQLESYLHQT